MTAKEICKVSAETDICFHNLLELIVRETDKDDYLFQLASALQKSQALLEDMLYNYLNTLGE